MLIDRFPENQLGEALDKSGFIPRSCGKELLTSTTMKKFIHNWKTALVLAAAMGAMLWAGASDSPAEKVSGIDELRQRQAKVQTIAKDAMPAVVALTNRELTRSGSGVIVSKDGLIMTASHVLDALPDPFIVTLADGTELEAKKLGANRSFDAALAQIVAKGDYPVVELADSAATGEWCVALGHPGGPEADRTPPIRLGKVWQIGKRSGFLTSDCPLSAGDSGGPLFNLDGKLIGIHSSISLNALQNRHVPVSAFHDSWDRMKKGENWGRLAASAILEDSVPWARPRNGALLGVNLLGLEATVQSVMPGSAAETAGLQPGDVIIEFDDNAVDTTIDLQRMVASKNPGDEVTLQVERDGKKLELKAELGGQS